MKIEFPAYTNSLLQVANSVRKYLGLECFHTTSSLLDAWLVEQDIKQVIVVLVDGMGSYQIKEQLSKEAFLNEHVADVIQSVYPSTTVAATTALRTGKAPCETGWLGWQQYLPSVQDHVEMFSSNAYYSDKKYPGSIKQTFPVEFIDQACVAKGIASKVIFPAWSGSDIDSFSKMCDEIRAVSKQDIPYVYAYWDEYDSLMHHHGVHSQKSMDELQRINLELEHIKQDLPKKTGLIILADHGHIDIKTKSLLDYPDIMQCLEHLPSLELRTLNFYVKDAYKPSFKDQFLAHFKDEFILYSHEEVMRNHLFGIGEEHPLFHELIGDYVACAISDTILTCGEDFADTIKGYHAGMSKKEMEIPLILFPKK